ncbi:MAG: sterol desaturase family protein [Pseudomonadota bacterium]
MSMDSFNSMLLPAVVVLVMFGVRFMVFAGIGFMLTDPSRQTSRGHSLVERPAQFQLAANVQRELWQSLRSLLIFAAIIAVIYQYKLLGSSQLYFGLDDYPRWWLVASVPAMMVLHDTLFYWYHRALHTRLLFKTVHGQHHDSVFPTAFAAYSFGTLEAITEAALPIAILFIIPVHPLALIIYQSISTAFNVYVHCSKDFLPAAYTHHWFWRWWNTAWLHSRHHLHSNGNYSFYFTFWDRLMKTGPKMHNKEV